MHLRSIFFQLLGPLKKLTVSFVPHFDYDHLSSFLHSLAWKNHISAMSQLSHHKSTQNIAELDLRLPCLLAGKQIPTSTWRQISLPFRAFSNVRVRGNFWTGERERNPFDPTDLASCFSADWVQKLEITCSPMFRYVGAFSNVSALTLNFRSKAIQSGLGEVLTSVSVSLEALKFQSMPLDTEDIPHFPEQMLRLASLTATGQYVSALEQLVRRVDLPKLNSIGILMSPHEWYTDGHELGIALSQFDSLVRHLPSHCCVRDFDLGVNLNMSEWQEDPDWFTSFPCSGRLSINALFTGFPIETQNLDEQSQAIATDAAGAQLFDSTALAAAMAKTGISRISQIQTLKIIVSPTMVPSLKGTPGDLRVEQLETLDITIESNTRKWGTHILHCIATGLSTPRLANLVVRHWSEQGDLERIFALLGLYLPLLPVLRQMVVYTHDEERTKLDPNYLALAALCEKRGVQCSAWEN